MTERTDRLAEDDLHAYIDDRLDPTRRLSVATYLATHPRDAALTEAYRAQSDGMRALFDHVLDQPVPDRLRAAARGSPVARVASRVAWGAAAACLVASLLWSGRALHDRLPSAADTPARPERPADIEIAPDAPVFAPPPALRRVAL
jgi:anti-sigma factor RsiW